MSAIRTYNVEAGLPEQLCGSLFGVDMNQILARLKKAGVPTLGETPMEMGAGTWLVAIKDPDGNFIEFVGPRK